MTHRDKNRKSSYSTKKFRRPKYEFKRHTKIPNKPLQDHLAEHVQKHLLCIRKLKHDSSQWGVHRTRKCVEHSSGQLYRCTNNCVCCCFDATVPSLLQNDEKSHVGLSEYCFVSIKTITIKETTNHASTRSRPIKRIHKLPKVPLVEEFSLRLVWKVWCQHPVPSETYSTKNDFSAVSSRRHNQTAQLDIKRRVELITRIYCSQHHPHLQVDRLRPRNALENMHVYVKEISLMQGRRLLASH